MPYSSVSSGSPTIRCDGRQAHRKGGGSAQGSCSRGCSSGVGNIGLRSGTPFLLRRMRTDQSDEMAAHGLRRVLELCGGREKEMAAGIEGGPRRPTRKIRHRLRMARRDTGAASPAGRRSRRRVDPAGGGAREELEHKHLNGAHRGRTGKGTGRRPVERAPTLGSSRAAFGAGGQVLHAGKRVGSRCTARARRHERRRAGQAELLTPAQRKKKS